MDIKNLLEKMNKFAGEPEQKPGDQVRGTDVAKKSKGNKHPFLHQLVGDSKKNEFKNQLIKEFKAFKDGDESEFGYKRVEPMIVKARQKYPMANSDTEALVLYIMDMEKNDVDRLQSANDREDSAIAKLGREEESLEHKIKRLEAELHSAQEELHSRNSVNEDPVPNPNAPAAPGQQKQPMSPQDIQKANQEKLNLQKNLTQIKAAGVNIDPTKMSQTLAKTDDNQPLNPMDKENVTKLAPAIGNIVANPQLTGQLKTLIQKAEQGH